MKTLRHPYSIPTPEKQELKSRYPYKNKGFEEPNLTRGESKLWAKSHWAVPMGHPNPLLKGAACTWRPTWGEWVVLFEHLAQSGRGRGGKTLWNREKTSAQVVHIHQPPRSACTSWQALYKHCHQQLQHHHHQQHHCTFVTSQQRC